MSEQETMENEVETNPLQDMIQHAINQDFNKANDVFNGMMSVKMSDLLDQEKIRLADQIYNGVDPEDEDEDQLDLDLEDEDNDEETEEEDLEAGDEDSEDEDEAIEDVAETESDEE